MNAYYSQVLFRDTDEELVIPGVARQHDAGEWVEISPIGTRLVTAISLSAQDIVAIVGLATTMFTQDDVDQMSLTLGLGTYDSPTDKKGLSLAE